MLDGDDVRSDDEGDEEEVFALKGIPDDESDEEEDEDSEDEDSDDNGQDLRKDPGPSKTQTKKGKQSAKALASSDEGSESEEEEESWGRSKAAYYSSNAAQLESDDEEANELEEQEAKRLQAKAREAMTDNDFGLEDILDGVAEPEECVSLYSKICVPDRSASEFVEPAAPVIPKLPEDKTSLPRYIEKTNPEALALAGDWDDAARALIKTQAKIAMWVPLV